MLRLTEREIRTNGSGRRQSDVLIHARASLYKALIKQPRSAYDIDMRKGKEDTLQLHLLPVDRLPVGHETIAKKMRNKTTKTNMECLRARIGPLERGEVPLF